MNSITNLYPQYHYSQDRRQNNIPVAVERRSGNDRRSQNRVVMDSKLTRDLYEVKERVAKMENFSPKVLTQRLTTQNPNFASKNSFTQDQFVKAAKPDISEIARQEAKLQEKAAMSHNAGMMAAALAGAIALSFMGAAGAVIAFGSALYIGSRVCKNMIVKEIKEDEQVNKN